MPKSHAVLKWSLLIATGLSCLVTLQAQKFYPDDPLEKEPKPWATVSPERRGLSSILEIATSIFGDQGEQHPELGVIPAGGVNTLGEVPDGPWYVNRHWRNRMTPEELKRGPGDRHPPIHGPEMGSVDREGFRDSSRDAYR